MPLDIFKEVLPAILKKKERVVTEDNESEYNSFLVNRALSYQPDCLFWVNELNRRSSLDNKMQFDFYLYKVKPGFRPFQKWLKPENEENIKFITKYAQVSRKKAAEILNTISEDELNEIKKEVNNKGGVVKKE